MMMVVVAFYGLNRNIRSKKYLFYLLYLCVFSCVLGSFLLLHSSTLVIVALLISCRSPCALWYCELLYIVL